MLTYSGALSLYQTLTKNSDAKNTTLFNVTYNEAIRQICSSFSWYFLQKSYTADTVDSQQSYVLPYDFKKLSSVTVTVGTSVYRPLEINTRKIWDNLNSCSSTESDQPDYYYIFDNKIYLYPTPSSSGNTITIIYKKRVIDLNIADYAIGTLTVTNGSAAVVGAGTTFTAAMVGRWIETTDDKGWYRISAFTDATHITLANEFTGTTAAGAAFTIGEITEIPEDFQLAPIYKAVSQFWLYNDGDKKYEYFNNMYLELNEQMKSYAGSITETVSVEEDGIDNIAEYFNPSISAS